MDIGFIGLGAMGSAMARNLVTAGHAVTVYNRSPAPAEAMAGQGAVRAATPGAAAAGGIAITMLADDAAVEAVTLGPDGLADGLPSGGIHIAMTTMSVALSDRLTQAHAERGQIFIAAPVFGRPDAAAAAKLFIAVAGAGDAIARVQPVLDVLGQRTFVIGATPSQANLVKLSGNFLITCVIESLAEAFALSEKGGVAPAILHELLTETLFNAPIYRTYGALILGGKFSPAGFTMPLGLKDNRLLLQAAEKLAVPLPFAAVVRDRLLSAIARGDGELDWSALSRRAAEDAGLRTCP